MTIIAIAKRWLRENRLSSPVYHGLARVTSGAHMIFRRLRHGRSYPQEFFDYLFTRGPDPWGYQASSVAAARRALLLNVLPAIRYRSLLELGCAAGWMTADLAARAETVTAVDISLVALGLAQARCEGCGNVEFRRLDIFTEEILGNFDAIVCAGVLVYLPWSAQDRVRARIVNAINPGGVLLLEHTCEASAGETAGRRIHGLYLGHPQLKVLTSVRRDIYEAMLLTRVSPPERALLNPASVG